MIHMGKPYVYIIESKNGEFYFGVRWNYFGNPEDDLWKNYFTSSNLIKQMILKEGVNYFSSKILDTFEKKEDALSREHSLIKTNIGNTKCLNRAIGKCTIWDELLKKRVSNSVKKLWENESYRKRGSLKSSGKNNHNYELLPWRNINSNIPSWKKVITIYDDFIRESWDLEKYGFGRNFLMKRYGICQGTARSFIKLVKNKWNPFLDSNYLLFLKENTRMS